MAENENAAPEDVMPDGIADDAAENEQPEGIADDGGDDGAVSENKHTSSENGNTDGEAKKEAPDYELAAPENFPLPAENLKSFGDAAKKFGLSREQAEGMLNWHKEFHEQAMAANEAAMKQQIADWKKEMAQDAEFGGVKEKETLANSRKALKEFDTDGSLRKFLRDTGQQFNPVVIRAIARVGRAMGEHDFVNGGAGGAKKPLEERLFPGMFN